MPRSHTETRKSPALSGAARALLAAVACCCGLLGGGCASITNPVANGIPVRRVPPELLAGPERETMQTIPLTLLKQKPPKTYLVAPRDVLGVYVEGILPATGANAPPSNPPVYFPSQIDPQGSGLDPALGFPIPVRDDGTLSLPLIDPINVAGQSIPEVTEAIRRAYLDSKMLQAGRERIVITLMQPRRTRVTVVRQELGGFLANSRGFVTTSSLKRGVGSVVDLRAYENDVLTALAETGGMPGLDDFSNILVFKNAQDNVQVVAALESLPPGRNPLYLAEFCPNVIVIPTRITVGQPLPFRPEDVLLENGDVVFLEARAAEVFFTGGLLPAAEFPIPRDYDLDVVEAVAQVKGSLFNGAFGGNNLNGLLIQRGIGNPNPTLLTVLRRTPNGGHVPIRVDLNRAMCDARERILVRPGDVLMLQETPQQALARYFSQIFSLHVIELGNPSRTLSTVTP